MLERGRVVISLAGRDKGRLLAVMQEEKNRVLICDGKERPVDRPKSISFTLNFRKDNGAVCCDSHGMLKVSRK